MKNLQLLFTLFIMVSLTIFISSCKKKEATNLPPVANFTFSGDDVPAPSVITFTNSSTNATTFSWTFGDGGTSTDQNPQHTYLSGGTFTVQLTATSSGGSNATSKTVTIKNSGTNITFNNPIYTDIVVTLNGATQTILPGNSVTFNSIPGSSVSYSAYTMGKTTSGTQVGLKLVWNNSLILTGGTNSYDLSVSSKYFFLTIKNKWQYELHNLYVNYGLPSQTFDNIFISNNSIEYGIGYYEAYTNSNIRMCTLDNTIAVTGFNFSFPWTDNQIIHVSFGPKSKNIIFNALSFDKSGNFDETHLSAVNPQFLKPAGNLKLNSEFDKNAIKDYCK